MLNPKCPDCGRVFDLLDENDAAEWSFGHDCEPLESPKPTVHAKRSLFLGGWVAYRHGRCVRASDHHIRVFQTEADALRAAHRSKMGCAGRKYR